MRYIDRQEKYVSSRASPYRWISLWSIKMSEHLQFSPFVWFEHGERRRIRERHCEQILSIIDEAHFSSRATKVTDKPEWMIGNDQPFSERKSINGNPVTPICLDRSDKLTENGFLILARQIIGTLDVVDADKMQTAVSKNCSQIDLLLSRLQSRQIEIWTRVRCNRWHAWSARERQGEVICFFLLRSRWKRRWIRRFSISMMMISD